MNRAHFVATAVVAATAAAVPLRARAESNDYHLETSHGTLFGTLTLPAKREAKVPVVLLLAGSGAIDRDGNSGSQLRTDAYKLIAAGLEERGIATVRFDKRGVAASAKAAPPESELRFDAYINDAIAWVKKLRADTRFGKIAIAGHSEGSLVGMVAALTAAPEAFISLEGAGRPIGEVMRAQLGDRLISSPDLLTASNRILDELIAGKTTSDVPSDLSAIFRPSVQPYLISWMKYDPRTEIKRLHARIAIVQGEADLQTSVIDAKNLAGAAPSAKLVLVPHMSHMLKDAAQDSTLQQQGATVYSDPSLPLDPLVVTTIAATFA